MLGLHPGPAGIVAASPSPYVKVAGTSHETWDISSLVVPLPGGIKAGDTLLLYVFDWMLDGGSPSISTPAGWTELDLTSDGPDPSSRALLLAKTATGSEGASVSITVNSQSRFAVALSALIRPGEGTRTAGDAGLNDFQPQTSVTAPAVTSPGLGTEYLFAGAEKATAPPAFLRPSGWTERGLFADGSRSRIHLYSRPVKAGSTGTTNLQLAGGGNARVLGATKVVLT